MTVIAWDGKTLAADKRGNSEARHFSVTKIFRLNDESLFAGFGYHGAAMKILEWLTQGSKPEDFPEQESEKEGFGLVIRKKGDGYQIERYENSHIPVVIENKIHTEGSGRDYAMAAMLCGKNSFGAVELAIKCDPCCGNGIDALELSEGKNKFDFLRFE